VKLGTLKNGTPDGQLIVVSRDLARAVGAGAIAPTLLSALENWDAAAPQLAALYAELNAGRAAGAFALDTKRLAAPLPRTWQWLDGSAFMSHGNLMDKVFNMPPIEGKDTIPLMYQGGSDDFLGCNDDMPFPTEEHGIDFEGEVGVIVDRVPMGTPAERAGAHIRLITLINDASLRKLAPREMKTGFGWIQAKPSCSFAPVAVTPDELGDAWRDGRVHLPLRVQWNGKDFGRPNARAMHFGFHQLVAHAAATRNLSAGTVIGSGTVSNEEYRTVGSACIAERRGIEIVDTGHPVTDYMKFGDRVRIEMLDEQGATVFGAIDHRVVRAVLP
jgi:fumarylacetoacetate (FAA) hydrolase